jgi:competence protein ComEC
MIYQYVVSFAIGIVFEEIFHFGWTVGLFVFILSLVSSLIIWKDNQRLAKIFFIIGLAFCIGVLRMAIADTSPDPILSQSVGQKISFEATISQEPDVRDTSTRYTVSPNFSKSLVLLVANRFPEFKYGDKINVSGKLDVPKNFTTDSGTEFDYVSYLSKNDINFLIYYPQIEKIGSGGNKIISYLYSLKNYFTEKISKVVPEPNSSFLAGLIFGAKQSLGEALLDDFQKVGLIHIVVLSGENLTIVAAAILSFVSYFGRKKFSLIFSALGIVIFSAMVGFTTTVLRAGIMALIAIMARYLGRPSDALRALFIAGFLMLAWNPLTLFYDPSFQLSFMAALGLIIWSPIIDLFIINKLNFIPQKFGLREIISATFAVQIFILPLLIKMSGNFSLISFVANLIILPMVPTVMFFGFITGFVGMIPAGVGLLLSWPFGFVSYLVSEVVIKMTEFFASIPFVNIQIGALPLWIIFIWYLGYGILFWRISSKIDLLSQHA